MITKKRIIKHFGNGVQSHAAEELGVSRATVTKWHPEIVWGSVAHKMIVGYLVLNNKKVPDFLK